MINMLVNTDGERSLPSSMSTCKPPKIHAWPKWWWFYPAVIRLTAVSRLTSWLDFNVNFPRYTLSGPSVSCPSLPLCPVHLNGLEFFCRTDNTCICSLCAETAEHRGHNVIPAKREWHIKKVCALVSPATPLWCLDCYIGHKSFLNTSKNNSLDGFCHFRWFVSHWGMFILLFSSFKMFALVSRICWLHFVKSKEAETRHI